MEINNLIGRARIPDKTIIGILSIVGEDETAINLEKDKKYRFTELDIIEIMDEISKWREKYKTAIKQKRALEDRVAELSKSAIR